MGSGNRVVHLEMNTILHEEKLEHVSEMVQYRKNLSWQIFSKFQGLKQKPADMMRFCESFRAGWQEWEKNGIDFHDVHEHSH